MVNRKVRPIFECPNCGEEKEVELNRVKTYDKHFCNRSCLGKYYAPQKKHNLGKYIEEGHISWNKGTKGVMKPNKGSFQKGVNHINYGKHLDIEIRKKISIANTGNVVSEETKLKLSLLNIGENHPHWLGGKSFEPYPYQFNIILKREIRDRDNDTCILCLTHRINLDKDLAIHHIDYDKDNVTKDNLISLCNSCHPKTNFKRDYYENLLSNIMKIKMGKIN